MYQEYAIDPTKICRNWERFRYVWSHLGYDRGRLLSLFPKKWFAELYESEAYKDLSPAEQSRVIEKFKQEKFQKNKIVPANRTVTEALSNWLEHAEAGHNLKAFHSIIADENPRRRSEVTLFDNLDEDLAPWQVATPWLVKRKAEQLASAANLLLQRGRKILFIDPHFCFERRYTNTFESYLEVIAKRALPVDYIEVHMNYSNKRGTEEFFLNDLKCNLNSKLRRYCPSSATLLRHMEFIVWEDSDDSEMHPRYILTEFAGLGFENGLDESAATETLTDVTRMGGESLKTRWDEFQETTSTRRLISRIHVRDLT